MDIKLPPKPWYVKYRALMALAILMVGLVAYTMMLLMQPNQMNVSASQVKMALARDTFFNEFVDVEGIVHPFAVIRFHALEGGIVERIMVDEGSYVHRGDTILQLSNPELLNSIRDSRAEWEKNVRNLREQDIQMQQQTLLLKEKTLTQRHEIRNLERSLQQSREEYRMGIKSKAQMEIEEANYAYQVEKLSLQMQSLAHDSASAVLRREMIQAERSGADRRLRQAEERIGNLYVLSPTEGQLGRLDITLGQKVQSGTTIGEIKIMNRYKIHTQLSEYYVERVSAGLPAAIVQKKDTVPLRVSRVMPEVKDRMFDTDLIFPDRLPENIRLGKSYRVKIELGQPEQALIIPRGDFYQHTGGRWIFRIDPHTGTALRTEIEIGRQNPEQFEVLKGLNPGDRVILSGYERISAAEEVVVKETEEKK